MDKYVPFEKLSKKKQRELNAKRRNTWRAINPVTRRPNPPKAYNRRKAPKWNDDSSSVPFLVFWAHALSPSYGADTYVGYVYSIQNKQSTRAIVANGTGALLKT